MVQKKLPGRNSKSKVKKGRRVLRQKQPSEEVKAAGKDLVKNCGRKVL